MGRETRLLIGILLTFGCTNREHLSAPKAQPLRVAAASDLQSVLPLLAERFEREHKIRVEFTTGASGQLTQQVRQGAPFDLFLSANRKFVDDLASEGVILRESVKAYARGTLVLVIHPAANVGIREIASLKAPAIKKIALANPDLAPYGLAGKQALERSGLWADLEPKIVRSETVRQALQFVETGNAEAGFVGRANVDSSKVRVVELAPELYDPIVQGMGVVARSPTRSNAEAFEDFLLSESGQAILADFGFRRPE
jgi:molybdate transport system substrate-binding protein